MTSWNGSRRTPSNEPTMRGGEHTERSGVNTLKDRDEQAIRTHLDKLDPNAENRRTVGQRPPTIVAQQRRLPGKPQPAGEFLAEYQEHNTKRRERIPGPLWVFWAPDPKDIFRWRIQLDCGCVEERIKHSLSGGDDDDKPTSGIATASDFDPLSREWLPPGEFLCSGKHRKRAQPIRDIGDWGERQVREFPADPVDPPEMWADQPDIWAVIRHAEPHKSAFWKALLLCGHFADVVTDVDWKPEDGPTYPTPKRLEEMRAEDADLSGTRRASGLTDRQLDHPVIARMGASSEALELPSPPMNDVADRPEDETGLEPLAKETVRLEADMGGYLAVATASGSISCLVRPGWIGCETPATNWPLHEDGTPYHSVTCDANGSIEWADGQMGDLARTTIGERTYRALGWKIVAVADGLLFTNDETGHGVCVTPQKVEGF
jgi:hypothetical protein